MKLAVVLGTIRENRSSERLAAWIVHEAQDRDGIEVELVDLKDYPMPFFDEPKSPRHNPDRRIAPTVQPWLEKLNAAEAYIFITPEYNHSIPGVLKNAIDYVTWELDKKPATVASHGTLGGARAAMHLNEILNESRAVVVQAHLAVTDLEGRITPDGTLSSAEQSAPHGLSARLTHLLDELQWYSDVLAPARAKR